MTRMKRPRFLDNTLREGEQVPGLAWTDGDRATLAAGLDACGMDLLDLGLPADDADWQRIAGLAAGLRQAEPGVTVRAREVDLERAASHGIPVVFLMVPASEIHLEHKFHLRPDEALAHLASLGELARRLGLRLHVVAEDASRGSPQLLAELARQAVDVGAEALWCCDTVGVQRPDRVGPWLAALQDAAPGLALGVHCHNDFGLATANTLAAAAAGADWLSTTMNGLGERAGNASTLEVAVALRHLYARDSSLDLPALRALALDIERRSGVPLALAAPWAGWAVFRHESGIHVDGMLKDARIYEPVDPALLGCSREFVLGVTSGRAHVRSLLTRAGLDLPADRVDALTLRLREAARESAMQTRAEAERWLAVRARRGVSETRLIDWLKAEGELDADV